MWHLDMFGERGGPHGHGEGGGLGKEMKKRCGGAKRTRQSKAGGPVKEFGQAGHPHQRLWQR